MRLLQVDTYQLCTREEPRSLDESDYAILSHAWEQDEAAFQDVYPQTDFEQLYPKEGFLKIRYTNHQADEDGLRYYWVDTCCIDKASSSELSEAINSMYRWYAKAKLCYVFLSDVDVEKGDGWEAQIRASRWFKRGWTLQELVAPRSVRFYDRNWSCLGNLEELAPLVADITHIDEKLLRHQTKLQDYSIAQRMSWAASRQTTRIEDRAYSLLGIFDIHMPLLYGEGVYAFARLQEQILSTSADHSILAWENRIAAPPNTGMPGDDSRPNCDNTTGMDALAETKRHYLEHNQISSVDRPYECAYADGQKTFKYRDRLIRHESLDRGPDGGPNTATTLTSLSQNYPPSQNTDEEDGAFTGAMLTGVEAEDECLTSLLAPTPECFAFAADIVPVPGVPRLPFDMTNRGLRITLPVICSEFDSSRAVAFLSCRLKHDCTVVIALNIKRSKPFPSASLFLPPDEEMGVECYVHGQPQRLEYLDCLNHLPSAKRWPLIIMRKSEGSISSPSSETSAPVRQARLHIPPRVDMEVLEYWPSEDWNRSTLTLTQDRPPFHKLVRPYSIIGGIRLFVPDLNLNISVAFSFLVRKSCYDRPREYGTIRLSGGDDVDLNEFCLPHPPAVTLPVVVSEYLPDGKFITVRMTKIIVQGDNLIQISISTGLLAEDSGEVVGYLTNSIGDFAWARRGSRGWRVFILGGIWMFTTLLHILWGPMSFLIFLTGLVQVLVHAGVVRVWLLYGEWYRQQMQSLGLADEQSSIFNE